MLAPAPQPVGLVRERKPLSASFPKFQFKEKGDKNMAADNTNSALDLRIDREFPPETREKTRSLLNRLTLINKEIVQNRILALAKGDAATVENLVKKVEKEDDFREALMFLQ
jgi:hypothetical protein